ncbi:hypothetical protein HPB47_005467 [Ixodes persulcatus]|uniref:Uncharacterized protein n=1 Tax=Ixodes persulcatus TaxID=34615 RepID=A0AC60PCW2_IXOPE|nr:hypothetical protein HPB47_005467 [Ixodes persulcatus]
MGEAEKPVGRHDHNQAILHILRFEKPNCTNIGIPHTIEQPPYRTNSAMSEEKLSSADAGLTKFASTFVPVQYAEGHSFQSASNSMTLHLFQPCFTRVPDANQQFLDIGCGTGDFTLQGLLPRCQPCRRIVAVDSSQMMIQHAQEKFAHPQITYDFLDIREDVSEFIKKYGQFDRVYSFYVLHWAKDQYTAFKNISDLMTPEGECLQMFGARLPAYDIWRRIVKKDRWTYYEEVTAFLRRL